MSFRIVVTRIARDETLQAYDYYENIRDGLGEEFLLELEYCYERLSQNPSAYSFIDKDFGIRDMRIPRFPFVIIFSIVKDAVVIAYIHNTHKNSQY